MLENNQNWILKKINDDVKNCKTLKAYVKKYYKAN